MGEIVLARHGQTEWSLGGRHTGRSDVPLTDVGRHQAERLGPRLRAWSFDRALTSPLRRAADTSTIAGFAGAEAREDLVEWDYGDYEGLTTSEIRERVPGWSLWTDGVPGGEMPGDMGARLDPLVAELREIEGDVVVFAHGHVLRVLTARWLGLPPAAGALFVLSTATVSVLGHERGTPALRLWNEGAHL